MLLAIDVGNTLTDFGFFADDKLLNSYLMDSDTKRSEDETRARLLLMFKSLEIELSEIDEVIISSVVPSIGTILTSLSQKLFNVKAKVIGPGLKNGLMMRVDNPSEVGADLIADAVGGKERYGNSLFIADLGTASKYLLIDEDGAYSGLAIAPGMKLSLDASFRNPGYVGDLRNRHVVEIPQNDERTVAFRQVRDSPMHCPRIRLPRQDLRRIRMLVGMFGQV